MHSDALRCTQMKAGGDGCHDRDRLPDPINTGLDAPLANLSWDSPNVSGFSRKKARVVIHPPAAVPVPIRLDRDCD